MWKGPSNIGYLTVIGASSQEVAVPPSILALGASFFGGSTEDSRIRI